MSFLGTLENIDTAIANLNLRQGTLKAQLLNEIRAHFSSSESLQSAAAIPAEELIRKLWQVEDPHDIQNKRKNLSGLKSAINKSLKDLIKKEQNPDGIIIGRDNTFTIAEEQKDQLIRQLGVSTESIHSMHEMLTSFKELLTDMSQETSIDNLKDLFNKLDETQQMMKHVARGEEIPAEAPVDAIDAEEIEITEIAEDDEEILTVDDHELVDEEDLEEVFEDELSEDESELQYIEEIEEIEKIDEEELIELDEDLIGDSDGDRSDDQEVEEIDDEELIELDEDMIGAGDGDGSDDQEVEEIDDEELIELDEDMIGAGDGDGIDDQEVEEIDDEELIELNEDMIGDGDGSDAQEVEEIDDEELIELDEDMIGAGDGDGSDDQEVEEIDDEELIELDEDLIGAGDGDRSDDQEADEIDDEELIELNEDMIGDGDGSDAQEVEEIDDEELIELDEDMIGAGDGDGSDDQEVEEIDDEELLELDEDMIGVGDGSDAQEVEEIDDEELIELDEDMIGDGDGSDAQEVEEINDEELIELDEDLIGVGDGDGSDDQEVEEIDDEELIELDEDLIGAGDGDGSDDQEVEEIDEESEPPPTEGRPEMLEALSKYIDPEEALSGKAEYLTEAHEEYLAQLLERFMPKFIKIPAGQYLIGSRHPSPVERPEQQITLDEYYIGQFPVINDLFEIFVRETGYETSAEKHGYGYVREGRYISSIDPSSGRKTLVVSNGAKEQRVAGATWRTPQGPGSTIKGKYNHPAVQISYADARAFAAWAGKRLPTEDEWEAAARGEDDRLFPWGNTWLPKLGNFESSALGDTAPVDHHTHEAASPYGLYDMLGNVYEWTASLHQPGHHPAGHKHNIHILKGGCWSSRKAIHIGHRMIEKADYWSNCIGFRCAV